MKSIYYIICLLITLSSHAAFAECLYGDAQKKMLRFNDLTQQKNLEVVKYQAAGQEAPADLYATVAKMGEESAAVGIQLGEAASDPNLTMTTPVDDSICQAYDALMQKYDPEGKHTVQPEIQDSACDSSDLWTRFGSAQQQVLKYFQQGVLSKEDVDQYRVLDVEIGMKSTTDMAAACALLEQYEARLSAVQ